MKVTITLQIDPNPFEDEPAPDIQAKVSDIEEYILANHDDVVNEVHINLSK